MRRYRWVFSLKGFTLQSTYNIFDYSNVKFQKLIFEKFLVGIFWNLNNLKTKPNTCIYDAENSIIELNKIIYRIKKIYPIEWLHCIFVWSVDCRHEY